MTNIRYSGCPSEEHSGPVTRGLFLGRCGFCRHQATSLKCRAVIRPSPPLCPITGRSASAQWNGLCVSPALGPGWHEVIPVVWTHLTMDLVDTGRCRSTWHGPRSTVRSSGPTRSRCGGRRHNRSGINACPCAHSRHETRPRPVRRGGRWPDRPAGRAGQSAVGARVGVGTEQGQPLVRLVDGVSEAAAVVGIHLVPDVAEAFLHPRYPLHHARTRRDPGASLFAVPVVEELTGRTEQVRRRPDQPPQFTAAVDEDRYGPAPQQHRVEGGDARCDVDA
ncbi:hypothetical protein OK006_6569 [Actinobacteria bacterium OK006]|nr:hypothetical protein OK006_6569 [Actinobacteria bacterium OK006]